MSDSVVVPKNDLNSKHKIEKAIFDEDFKNIFLNSIEDYKEFRGLINIDGGHVGIATEWLPTCMECDNNYFEKMCEICGRNSENYVDFRSGRGDGCYPVYSIFASGNNPLALESMPLGSMILFDFEKGLHSIGQLLSDQINELNELEDHDELSDLFEEFENLPNIIIDLYGNSLEIYEVCELKSSLASGISVNEFWRKNLIVMGESGEGIDSDSSLVNSTNIGAGNFKVLLVGDRDKENNNIFVPGIAFILESNFCEQIGLVSNLIPKLDIKIEKELWNNSYVDSHVGNPQSDVAFNCNFIIWNYLRNISLSNKDLNYMHKYASNNAASWLMMLYHSKPSSTILNILQQIIDGSGVDPNLIHKARGQFNRELFNFNEQSNIVELATKENIVGLTTKAQILVDFLNRYAEEVAFHEFFAYNDLGLPLAVSVFNNLCELNEKGISALEETYTELLIALKISDLSKEYNNLDEILYDSDLEEE